MLIIATIAAASANRSAGWLTEKQAATQGSKRQQKTSVYNPEISTPGYILPAIPFTKCSLTVTCQPNLWTHNVALRIAVSPFP